MQSVINDLIIHQRRSNAFEIWTMSRTRTSYSPRIAVFLKDFTTLHTEHLYCRKTRRLRKKTTESSTQLEGQSNEISDQRHESIDNTVLPSVENDAASTSGRVGVPTLSTPGYIDMQNLSGGRNENANSECLRRDLAENTKDMSKASYVSMKGVMPNRRKQTYQNVKKGKMSKWEIQTNKATATCIGEDALEESVYANDISEELYANT